MGSLFKPLASTAFFAAFSTAQVTLNGSLLEGGRCESSNASYYYAIPYAKPPIGDLRFAPPQPYEGELGGDATQQGAICPQFSGFIEDTAASEDCLFLNIWVPADAQDLPVKVWLHGGGNSAGSINNPTYDGCNLATDTIVVNVAYRLGPLGFLAYSDEGIQGNMGIQDQLLALEWVRSNIESFGGDPSKVLLFGESAGASDAYAIGTLPGISSLIRGGAAQSGAGGIYPLAESANAQGASWAQSIGCSDAECLRSLDVSDLNATLPPTGVPSYNGYVFDGWGAIVDGDIIPVQPNDVGAQVPFIMGWNSNEGTLLILLSAGSPTSITPEIYTARMQAQFGPAASLVLDRYPVSSFNNTAFPPFSALDRVITESNFICPTYNALRATAANNGIAYSYQWSQKPTCPWFEGISVDGLPLLGAAHTAEIPYIFGNTENQPLPNGNCSFTASERALSAEFVGFWTNMAANGEPGSDWQPFNNAINEPFEDDPGSIVASAQGVIVEDGASSANALITGDYGVCDFWERVRNVVLENGGGALPLPGNATVGGDGVATATGGATASAYPGQTSAAGDGNGAVSPNPSHSQMPAPYEGGADGTGGSLVGSWSALVAGILLVA